MIRLARYCPYGGYIEEKICTFGNLAKRVDLILYGHLKNKSEVLGGGSLVIWWRRKGKREKILPTK